MDLARTQAHMPAGERAGATRHGQGPRVEGKVFRVSFCKNTTADDRWDRLDRGLSAQKGRGYRQKSTPHCFSSTRLSDETADVGTGAAGIELGIWRARAAAATAGLGRGSC